MKKLIALALALVMVLAFAACTKAPAEDSGKKQIVMGTNAAFPPYEFVNDDGSFGGIDVDIAKAIADKLGYELVIKDMEFDSLIAAVDGGSIDFAMAGMTVTDERKESVNFSFYNTWESWCPKWRDKWNRISFSHILKVFVLYKV